MERKRNFDKRGIQKATIRPNVEKLRQRQRHTTGLHSAEEIEQLIISHKRKNNEMPPTTHSAYCAAPSLLQSHTYAEQHIEANTHTHTHIFPKQLKKQRWSSHLEQIKLQFIF